jgi:60 kDa SS-A/Ro ribonucleoprotein
MTEDKAFNAPLDRRPPPASLGNGSRKEGSVDSRGTARSVAAGSMSSPVTGWFGRATTATRCVDVAALIAAAILRNKRGNAEVIPFGDRVVPIAFSPGASVMQNAARLAALDGGGTCSSAPLAWLNQRQARGALVVMVSDSESWVDRRTDRQTETLVQWEIFRRRNPEARLVCIDLTPNTTAQCPERDDILPVGGFSDVVET